MTVPFISVVIRRAYGLGAMAMLGGHLKRPSLCLAWHVAEFGGYPYTYIIYTKDIYIYIYI